MNRISMTFVLLLAALFASAQTSTYTGRVTDDEKNDLMAATVRCFVGDSTFVKGATTNAKGEFKLEVPQTDKV